MVNIPVIIAAIFIGCFCIPEDAKTTDGKPLDLAGLSLFIISVVSILAAASLFQVPGTPNSVLILLVIIGIVAGIIFFVRERGSTDPLISRSLLENKYFNRGIVACFIITALFSGVTYLMPLYLVNSRHLDQFVAGLIMMIPALISIIAAPISGSLSDRFGSPIVSAGAIGLSAIGFLVFFTFNPATSVVVIVAGMMITRVSTASFFGPNGRLIMGQCPPEALGNGSGVMMTVRHAGLVVGIALFQSVFAIRMYLDGVPRDGTPLVSHISTAQSVLGYQAVYLTAFCLALVVIAIVIFTKDKQYPD